LGCSISIDSVFIRVRVWCKWPTCPVGESLSLSSSPSLGVTRECENLKPPAPYGRHTVAAGRGQRFEGAVEGGRRVFGVLSSVEPGGAVVAQQEVCRQRRVRASPLLRRVGEDEWDDKGGLAGLLFHPSPSRCFGPACRFAAR